MQEDVGAQLPNEADVRNFCRNQSKPSKPPLCASGNPAGKHLQDINGNAGDADRLDRARKVFAYVEGVTATAVGAPVKGHRSRFYGLGRMESKRRRAGSDAYACCIRLISS